MKGSGCSSAIAKPTISMAVAATICWKAMAGETICKGMRGLTGWMAGDQADRMAGGAGNDFYIVDHLGDEVIEGLNNGTDRVESSVSFTLGANVEHLTLTGTDDLNGTGNELNNDITGNGGINRLEGRGGTDRLIGGDKNDILARRHRRQRSPRRRRGVRHLHLQRRATASIRSRIQTPRARSSSMAAAPRRDQYRWRRHLCKSGWHRDLCPLQWPLDREWGAHGECRFSERAVWDSTRRSVESSHEYGRTDRALSVGA